MIGCVFGDGSEAYHAMERRLLVRSGWSDRRNEVAILPASSENAAKVLSLQDAESRQLPKIGVIRRNGSLVDSAS